MKIIYSKFVVEHKIFMHKPVNVYNFRENVEYTLVNLLGYLLHIRDPVIQLRTERNHGRSIDERIEKAGI